MSKLVSVQVNIPDEIIAVIKQYQTAHKILHGRVISREAVILMMAAQQFGWLQSAVVEMIVEINKRIEI